MRFLDIICDKYNIPYSNEEVYKLINLHYMIQILRCDSYRPHRYFLTYKEGYLASIELTPGIIKIEYVKKEFFINTVVKNWEEIYKEAISLII